MEEGSLCCAPQEGEHAVSRARIQGLRQLEYAKARPTCTATGLLRGLELRWQALGNELGRPVDQDMAHRHGQHGRYRGTRHATLHVEPCQPACWCCPPCSVPQSLAKQEQELRGHADNVAGVYWHPTSPEKLASVGLNSEKSIRRVAPPPAWRLPGGHS
jgi:hypothetical protein